MLCVLCKQPHRQNNLLLQPGETTRSCLAAGSRGADTHTPSTLPICVTLISGFRTAVNPSGIVGGSVRGNSRPGSGDSAAPGHAASTPESETRRKCLNQGRSYVPAPAALLTAAPEPHGGGGREGAVLRGGDSQEPLEQRGPGWAPGGDPGLGGDIPGRSGAVPGRSPAARSPCLQLQRRAPSRGRCPVRCRCPARCGISAPTRCGVCAPAREVSVPGPGVVLVRCPGPCGVGARACVVSVRCRCAAPTR